MWPNVIFMRGRQEGQGQRRCNEGHRVQRERSEDVPLLVLRILVDVEPELSNVDNYLEAGKGKEQIGNSYTRGPVSRDFTGGAELCRQHRWM